MLSPNYRAIFAIPEASRSREKGYPERFPERSPERSPGTPRKGPRKDSWKDPRKHSQIAIRVACWDNLGMGSRFTNSRSLDQRFVKRPIINVSKPRRPINLPTSPCWWKLSDFIKNTSALQKMRAVLLIILRVERTRLDKI